MDNKEIEQLIKQEQLETRKKQREGKRLEKELKAIEKANKPVKTESDLVRQYANTIMSKQATRGMLRKEFKDIEKKTPTKNLWQDNDFFFSVVFQSSAQKLQFLAFLGQKYDIQSSRTEFTTIQILNGLKLAESMGCDLKKEVANDYQPANLELRDLILDT